MTFKHRILISEFIKIKKIESFSNNNFKLVCIELKVLGLCSFPSFIDFESPIYVNHKFVGFTGFHC